MANGYETAGGGGGAIILQVNGQVGMTATATLGNRTKTGIIGDTGVLQLRLPKLGVWQVKAEKGETSVSADVKVFGYGITEWNAVDAQIYTAFKLYDLNENSYAYDLKAHFPSSYETLAEENFVLRTKSVEAYVWDSDHSGVNFAFTLTIIKKNENSLTINKSASGSNPQNFTGAIGIRSTLNSPVELWYIGPARPDYVP